jgi:adenylate cyclase
MRVLIVEDNRDSRDLVNDIISRRGYSTILAENGRVALEYIQQDIPDLIILDINMPEMDGFEVLRTLKMNPATAEIPILMLTAQADIDSRVTGLGLGADDYLAKPFYPRELLARVETRLRAKELTDSLTEQREQIRRTFERFVAPEIVERLLEDPTRVALGGVEVVVTVLFADLESYSPIAVSTAPSELIGVLNQYLLLLVEHIKANGGTVDKFLGDGVMALYNTPLPLEDHALRAVRTALDMRAALEEFHTTLDPQFRLGINIGIHTGPAIVGNIGTPDLMDYTAIGDTVNLASRLQGLSEHSQITISEDTYDLVADFVTAERREPRVIRGREEPVTTYVIIGLRA